MMVQWETTVMAGTLCDPGILDRCDPDGRSLARSFACTASGERASGAGAAGGTASVCGSVSRPSEE